MALRDWKCNEPGCGFVKKDVLDSEPEPYCEKCNSDIPQMNKTMEPAIGRSSFKIKLGSYNNNPNWPDGA